MLAVRIEDEQRGEGLEAADHHERVEAVLLEFGRDGANVHVGQLAVRTQLGAAAGHPVVDAKPR